MNNSNLYSVVPLLDRLEDLLPGEKVRCLQERIEGTLMLNTLKVEVLELCVGCLYVGTSQGSLLQYGVSEDTTADGRKGLTASFLTRTVLSSGNKITFLYTAPAINRMLVMIDGSLYVLNMSDMAILPMAASNKLKGLSAVCVNVNPVSDNPFSVEVSMKY